MNPEWVDSEREPRRMVQMFDAQAQIVYKNWSPQLKLEWLASILKIYWLGRQHTDKPALRAAEKKRPYLEI